MLSAIIGVLRGTEESRVKRYSIYYSVNGIPVAKPAVVEGRSFKEARSEFRRLFGVVYRSKSHWRNATYTIEQIFADS
jgi:hypothetical protein